MDTEPIVVAATEVAPLPEAAPPSLATTLGDPIHRATTVRMALVGAVVGLISVVLGMLAASSQPGFEAIGNFALTAPALLALLAGLLLGVITGGVFGWTGARRIEGSIAALRATADAALAGDVSRRTHLAEGGTLGALSASLDRLLDEHASSLHDRANLIRHSTTALPGDMDADADADAESEDLNSSVIEIMQAIGEIATSKDLSIRMPVTENVTGAIADALNLLTEETARVLTNVARVSRDVARATVAVKSQSDLANHAASREQREVELAAGELGQAASALMSIAEHARHCDELADITVRATAAAVGSVDGTVKGVVESRELIRETEKRIKRLGERSQEIGQVVGIIQTIAERTGILALNAAMHAAAAGEAGRSFASVADEVRRLSESAREATSQISRLVVSIQTETNDTVLAMNQAIGKVVEITRLADDAGTAMRTTQQETSTLASTVRDIARTSTEQAKVGTGLQERARIIQEASIETGRQLSLQTAETRALVEYAKALLDEVSVFKLPEPPAS